MTNWIWYKIKGPTQKGFFEVGFFCVMQNDMRVTLKSVFDFWVTLIPISWDLQDSLHSLSLPVLLKVGIDEEIVFICFLRIVSLCAFR